MSAPAERHGLHALVVDDDEGVRQLARAALESIGFSVQSAEDGAAALALLDRFHPDLVLLDVVMPRLDGFGFCRAVRARARFQQTPILLMTGLDDLDSISRAYEVGATDFVTKPVNWEILKHRVRYVVRASVAFQGLATAQRVARLGSWEWVLADDSVVVSDELRRVFGVERDVAITCSALTETIHVEDRSAVAARRERAIAAGASYEIGYRIARGDGSERFVRENGDVVRSSQGSVTRLVGTIQDITERRAVEEEIAHLAYHDTLTGLPNRRAFSERLERALAEARDAGRTLSLLYLDLDRFKRVNDTYGHTSGDAVLARVSRRLTDTMSEASSTDPAVDSAASLPWARLGGDEFVLLLEGATDDQASSSARRVIACLERPFDVQGAEVSVTPSIGITRFPRDGESLEQLMKNADIAMYHAKESGRNTYRFHTPELAERTQRRLLIESEVGEALRRGELRLEYQPIVRAVGHELAMAEALLRWDHPTLGPVRPDEFIPLAEQSGALLEIGDWVIHQAAAACVEWQRSPAGPTRVAVNVSAAQLHGGDVTEVVERALAATGLDPTLLVIELTESVLMIDEEASTRQLEVLREMGVRVSIDDFGTGYSSLSYLHRLPIQELKIDRSFIDRIADDPDTTAIVEAIVAMAHKLRIEVIAEGVERPADLRVVQDAGCHLAQGYLFDRPLRPEQFDERWLRRRRLPRTAA